MKCHLRTIRLCQDRRRRDKLIFDLGKETKRNTMKKAVVSELAEATHDGQESSKAPRQPKRANKWREHTVMANLPRSGTSRETTDFRIRRLQETETAIPIRESPRVMSKL